MDFIGDLVLSIIFILFPLSIFLIYVAYKNNINEKEKNIVFSFCVLTSLYLMVRFCRENEAYYMLLINTPLLISFIKQRKVLSLVLIIGIVIYYTINFNVNSLFVIGEYLLYYVLFYHALKKKINTEIVINTFILIKGAILSFEMYYIVGWMFNDGYMFAKLFLLLALFYGITTLIILLLEKGAEIVNLNNSLKELEKEKTLRSSLFKITHEIKNPIAVCKGYLDMMDYNDSKKVRKYNMIIQKEINRTLNIMDDFLEYTKIKVNMDVIDIYMLLDDVIDSMSSLFNHHNIEVITSEFNDELFIIGDYNKLKQAVINIIKNSIEAIEKDGKIEISTEIKRGHLIVKIKDNGVGMNKETLSRISEMFYTTKERGTGLGVGLSKEIIDLHRGTLGYQSQLGEGTLVTIKLPIEKLRES